MFWPKPCGGNYQMEDLTAFFFSPCPGSRKFVFSNYAEPEESGTDFLVEGKSAKANNPRP